MELNATGHDLNLESDAGLSIIGFEADRIAQRRVFEDDSSALIIEQTKIG